MKRRFRRVVGVDFSGAAQAGDNTWLAYCDVTPRRLRLRAVNRLTDIVGTSSREPALRALVGKISVSDDALWGIDFPFSIPLDLHEMGRTWSQQLGFLARWEGGPVEFGRWCLAHALRIGEKMHIRRQTDVAVSTPFDCYHYRIIYQTFHGMRDVLLPLITRPRVAIAPFQLRRVERAGAVVVESCPGSTLRRMKLPYNNYKQPTGGALTGKRRRTRHAILDGLRAHIEIDDAQLRTIMRNPGGDALDAVIAAVGAHHAWRSTDLTGAACARFRNEGFIFS